MADLTAADVVTAVRRHYGCETDDLGPEWAALDEMDLQPGYSTRRIDLLLVRAWRGKVGHERHAVEVKVSRADVRRELESAKWEAWAAVTHRFYLAIPAALNLDGLDLPDTWGVLTVDGRGCRKAVKAPKREPDDLPESAWVEAFRRGARAEARIRQADAEDHAAVIAQLERDVLSLQRSVGTARQAEDRWKRRADDVMSLLALVHPAPVCRCGAPLKPMRRGSIRWEHADTAGQLHGTECRWPGIDTDALADSSLPELVEVHRG